MDEASNWPSRPWLLAQASIPPHRSRHIERARATDQANSRARASHGGTTTCCPRPAPRAIVGSHRCSTGWPGTRRDQLGGLVAVGRAVRRRSARRIVGGAPRRFTLRCSSARDQRRLDMTGAPVGPCGWFDVDVRDTGHTGPLAPVDGPRRWRRLPSQAREASTHAADRGQRCPGLEVVLADRRIVHTEGHGPRHRTQPDPAFVGSEGTPGVITSVFRIHPLPPAQERRAFGFTSFAAGLEACRKILRRGATWRCSASTTRRSQPGTRNSPTTCSSCSTKPTRPSWPPPCPSLTTRRTGPAGARSCSTSPWSSWLGHRNVVVSASSTWRAGIVVDTAEIADQGPLPDSSRRW